MRRSRTYRYRTVVAACRLLGHPSRTLTYAGAGNARTACPCGYIDVCDRGFAVYAQPPQPPPHDADFYDIGRRSSHAWAAEAHGCEVPDLYGMLRRAKEDGATTKAQINAWVTGWCAALHGAQARLRDPR
jgi:hypothetical protein